MQKEKQKNNKIEFIINDFPSSLKKEVNSFLGSLSFSPEFINTIKNSQSKINVFEINCVDVHTITTLNKKYRSIKAPTDVLSFNLNYIGEIDLSLDCIKDNAKVLKISFVEEVCRCIIHGCLHILDYDHVGKFDSLSLEPEAMFIIQESILHSCLIK